MFHKNKVIWRAGQGVFRFVLKRMCLQLTNYQGVAILEQHVDFYLGARFMKPLFSLFCLICLVVGCDQSPEQGADIETLKQHFVDREQSQVERISSGLVLVQQKAGLDYLATQYWKGHRVAVQAVVDSGYVTQPEVAAQLLARLMADAGGEAKLHFEAQLIKLGPRAVDALVQLAESETDWQTLMRTLDALGKIGARQGVPVMRAHLSHPNDWVRMTAAHALGDVGGPDVVPALVRGLKDSSDTVVSAVLVGLGKTGDRRAVRVCGDMLSHDNPRVRAAAVSALGRLGGTGVRALLTPMLEDSDSGVRFKAQQALASLK